jgi:hypothetical protein
MEFFMLRVLFWSFFASTGFINHTIKYNRIDILKQTFSRFSWSHRENMLPEHPMLERLRRAGLLRAQAQDRGTSDVSQGYGSSRHEEAELSYQKEEEILCSIIAEIMNPQNKKRFKDYEAEIKKCTSIAKQHPQLKAFFERHLQTTSLRQFTNDFLSLPNQELPAKISGQREKIRKDISQLSPFAKACLVTKLSSKF